MKKSTYLVLLVFLLSTNRVTAQEINISYSNCELDEMIKQYGQIISKESYSFLYNDYDESILKEGVKYVKRQVQIDEAYANESREMQKLETYKKQYGSFEKYPNVILDGWHLAVISDNSRFCKQVKVLVKGNKIEKLVVNDYLPISVQAFTKIKDAKSTVNLEHFGKEELVPVDVYFLFDMEEPNIVDEPLPPGIVCFWTSLKNNYEEIIIKVEGKKLMNPSATFRDLPPKCGELGTSYSILKPGRYQFIALGRGSIDWKGQIDVKEGKCTLVELAK